jgi:hypothetical protein
MKGFPTSLLFLLPLLVSCATTEPETVVNDNEVLLYLDPDLRPEPLLFPEYLLMADFEIDQHGKIPNSTLVCAGIKTMLNLTTTHQHLNQLLATEGWTITKDENAEHFFRLLATKQSESLEIRAVQGTSPPVQVLLLYRPES